MSLDKSTVAKIAKLAHIEVADAEQEHFAHELSGIFKWIEQLSSVNTQGIPNLLSVSDASLPLREDIINDGHCRDSILANAPMNDYGCFVVPKVIE